MGVDGVEMGKRRRELMEILGDLIQAASEKYGKIKASNKDRQAWGRLIVSAVDSYNSILRDVDLDEIRSRLEKLEALKP